MVICLEQGAELHTTQQMPLPLTGSCFSKIHIGFTFPVPAHPGSPGKRAVKRVCVCYYFASATVMVYSSHMTALSSASWSRFGPRSNFVTGHVSTMWYIFTVKRRKTRSRWKASQEFL